MTETLRRYQSPEHDSARWTDFPLRDGDIIVSTPPKSGTTWAQMMCALLIFQTRDLPQPLETLSPWLDQLDTPADEVYARLAGQQHRRVIKTHTPLDGLPIDPRASYVVVARHPLDRALSLYHQASNIDFERLRSLRGVPEAQERRDPPAKPSVHEWLRHWCVPQPTDGSGTAAPGGLRETIHHLHDAWVRQAEPNVRLLHYADLSADLDGEMSALAEWLGITVDGSIWPDLVRAATFDEMKSRAGQLAPGSRILKDPTRFFHSGRSGASREVLTADELDTYRERVSGLAPEPFLDWLHRDPPPRG